MFNPTQFRELIIRPVLGKLALWSQEAEDLLIMTAAHESNLGEYLKQLGPGPALGVFQMEKGTFNDLWDRFLNQKPKLVDRIMKTCNLREKPAAEEMIDDLNLATCMARVYFLRVRQPIPTDLDQMAAYAKKYWNTELGKATPEDYLAAYLRFENLKKRA